MGVRYFDIEVQRVVSVDIAVSPFFTKYNFSFKNTVFYSLEYYFLWAKVGISALRLKADPWLIDRWPFILTHFLGSFCQRRFDHVIIRGRSRSRPFCPWSLSHCQSLKSAMKIPSNPTFLSYPHNPRFPYWLKIYPSQPCTHFRTQPLQSSVVKNLTDSQPFERRIHPHLS